MPLSLYYCTRNGLANSSRRPRRSREGTQQGWVCLPLQKRGQARGNGRHEAGPGVDLVDSKQAVIQQRAADGSLCCSGAALVSKAGNQQPRTTRVMPCERLANAAGQR